MKPRLNEIPLTLLYLNNKLSMSYLNLVMCIRILGVVKGQGVVIEI